MLVSAMKTSVAVPIFVAAFATAIHAQPTTIGKHHMGESRQEWESALLAPHSLGETVPDWLRLNNLDVDAICQGRSNTEANTKAVCKKLSEIKKAGRGEFSTVDDSGQEITWLFRNAAAVDFQINSYWMHDTIKNKLLGSASEHPNERYTHVKERSYKWKFINDRLAEIDVMTNAFYRDYERFHPDPYIVFSEEVSALTSMYGKPSDIKAVRYHNAYGAEWEASEVYWKMPDSTLIMALEDTDFSKHGKLLTTTFLSKEAVSKQQQQQPNPYAK
jgi:hypothetical protein